ncbi:MAG: hypothetical protein LBS90_08080 [Oscillospiraceae bacterium]|jgi:hypothetical protein|nr:hypothetical protein [Oscillospiraceae bacterium]
MQISLEDRIIGLSQLWSTAKYNFARWDELPGLDWDAEYRAALPRVIAADDPAAYYAELMKLVTLLRDGHSYVVMPDEIKPPYAVPFYTSHRWGGHVVSSLPKDCGVPIYSRITAINGTPVEDWCREKAYPYVWHEKADSRFYQGALGYIIGCHETGAITIDTDGGAFTVRHGEERELAEPPRLSHPEFETAELLHRTDGCCSLYKTADNIAIFEVDTCQDPTLKAALYENLDKFRACRGFVIDVRYNNGGSSRNVEPLVQLFFESEFDFGAGYSPLYIPVYAAMAQYRYPDRYEGLTETEAKLIHEIAEHKSFYVDNYKTRVADCPAFLAQPVVVLSGLSTASAAESVLTAMKYQNRAVIVGERSYGSTGQPIFGQLPGGGYFGVCTQKGVMPDGADFNNIGIAPDIEASISKEDALNGFDRVFDKGLEVLRGML